MRAYVLAATVLLSGCSVGMAVSGDHNPELGAVRSGVPRGEIEMHLGSPVKISSLNDGLGYATDLPPGTGHSVRESWLVIVPAVGLVVISPGACPW